MVRRLSRTVAILTVAALAATSVPRVDARTLPLTHQQSQVDLWLDAASVWLVLPGLSGDISGGGRRLEASGAVKTPEKARRRGGRLLPTCSLIDPWGRCY
jgi:hypothetical protein